MSLRVFSRSLSLSLDALKSLRASTGVSLSDCTQALLASNHDPEQALIWLRKQGRKVAQNRGTGSVGLVGWYEMN